MGRPRATERALSSVDLADLPVIDGHGHPLLPDPWAVSPETFQDLFSEGRAGAMAAHVAQTTYHHRALRALAARFGTAPDVAAILAARQAAGPEAARRWLAEARVAALLIDTGYPPDGGMPLVGMRELLPCRLHEVFRIETCAESLLGRDLSWDWFLEAFRGALRSAAERCVAFKTVVAYRSGLAVRRWDRDDVMAAYRRAVARAEAGKPRLTEKPLLDTLVYEVLDVARATGRPVQVHTGFGDPDIDLVAANPLLLRPLLEDLRWANVRLVLLHLAYPYAREAAFMAAVWPQVYVDLSLALPFLGRALLPSLIETLALAPATKLLYGSDVRALPELFALAAEWGRATIGEALGWLVERGDLTGDEAGAAGRAILAGNAATLYGLEPV